MPSRMVPHYQPCILVWCLTIGHVFSCGASLSAMPVCVVPHYRPCLLASYLTIGHACWSIATETDIFPSQAQMEEEWSLVLLVQRCHYIRHVCWHGAALRYACLNSATLSDMHAVFIYSYMRVCKVLIYQVRHLFCYKPIRHAYR